jgi:hypothetical protein
MSPLGLALLCTTLGAAAPGAGVGALPVDAPADAGPRPVEVPPDVIADADAGVVDDAPDAGTADAGTADATIADAPLPPGFSLSARVEPDPVVFGRIVELVVTVTRPGGRALQLPDDLEGSETLPRSGPPRRDARELSSSPSASSSSPSSSPGGGDARIQETLRFPFLALDLDELRTPAFVLRTADGAALAVPALPVRVVPDALPDPTDGGAPDGALVVEAEAPFLMYRVRDDRPWIALVIVVVGALVVVVARLLLRRRPARVDPGPPPPPPRPAHEIALERLDALMPLLQRGEVSLFVEKLMDEVLRDYLALRFALQAGTRTTREIVGDLLGVAVVGLDVGLVERIGQDADLIKFARATLSGEQAHGMAGRVRALIVATAARPPAGNDAGNDAGQPGARR